MQTRPLTTEEERQFIKEVIEFIKTEIIRKDNNTEVSDRFLCKQILKINPNNLCEAKKGSRPFTVAMKTALHTYLVRQLEQLKSTDRESTNTKKLDDMVAKLGNIVTTTPWLEPSLQKTKPRTDKLKLQGSNVTPLSQPAEDTFNSAKDHSAIPVVSNLRRLSTFAPTAVTTIMSTAEENEFIKRVMKFIKTELLLESNKKEVTDFEISRLIPAISKSNISKWNHGVIRFTVSMKQGLYKFLFARRQKLKALNENDPLILKLEQFLTQLEPILRTKPWLAERNVWNQKPSSDNLFEAESAPAAAATTKTTTASHSNNRTDAAALAELPWMDFFYPETVSDKIIIGPDLASENQIQELPPPELVERDKKRNRSQLASETIYAAAMAAPQAKRTKGSAPNTDQHMTEIQPDDVESASRNDPLSSHSTLAPTANSDAPDDEPADEAFSGFLTFKTDDPDGLMQITPDERFNLTTTLDSEATPYDRAEPFDLEAYDSEPANAGLSNLRRFSAFSPARVSQPPLDRENEQNNDFLFF